MPEIGLQMYTLRDYSKTKEEYLETVRRVAEIGYRNLQVRHVPFLTVEEHKALLDKYSIKADSVFLPVGEIESGIERAVAEAKIFGVDVIRTDSIPEKYRSDEKGYRTFAKELDRLGEICRDHGLRLIYHFHAFEFVTFGDVRGIDILLSDTSPENVYFMPDVFWLTNAGTEPSVSLRMFAGRAFYMHVKDYAIRKLEGKIEDVPFHFAPVGDGNLNWDGIVKTANDIGITHFVVEQDRCEGDVFEAIERSYKALHRMLNV